MNPRLWTVPLLVALIGCAAEKPAPPPPPPKDFVRIEPGPVDADAPEEYTQATSGLKYRIRRKSDGTKPTAESLVRVHYRGRLIKDGELGDIFDTTYGRFGHSNEFVLSGLVPGWTEGLLMIGEGGMIELEIPPAVGYGERSVGPIPPNSTLHFIVELIEVKSAPADAANTPAETKSSPSEENRSPAESKPASKEEKKSPAEGETKPAEATGAPAENKAE